MKRSITFFVSIIAYLSFMSVVNAADLVVLQGGTYSTIGAAIAAASDNDRIIVTPIAAGAPYTENLVIDKSLQFLSATEGTMFAVSGSITITPANARTVTFIGMKNVMGSLDGSMSSPAGVRTTVNILNCDFESGNINLDYDYYNLNLASSIVKGKITFRFGRVIGSEITAVGSTIIVNTDVVQSNDTISIIGNKIRASYIPSAYYGILINSSSQYFSIYNNYIMTGGNEWWYDQRWAACIYINTAKNSNTGKNFVVNNTVTRDNIATSYNNYSVGILFANIPANASIEAMNNLVLGDNTYPFAYGIYGTAITGNVSTSYSFFRNTTTLYTALLDNGTNNLTSNSSIGADGKLVAGSDGIDGGNSDSTYYDIDLTPNDVGCYGGSLTFDNFYPNTGTARVYFVTAPRRIIIGNNLNIKAEAFDR